MIIVIMLNHLINTVLQEHLGTSIITSMRMRYDLKGNLGDVILSKNARIVVESASEQSITNMTNRPAVVRSLTSTEDKVYDTKKLYSWSPVLF